MDLTSSLISCPCGNKTEPICYNNEATNVYKGIYFFIGQVESTTPTVCEPENVPTSPIVDKCVSTANDGVLPTKPQVAVISPLVATPACVDSPIIPSDTTPELLQHRSELLQSEPRTEMISDATIRSIIADAIKNFHKSGKKLRTVQTKPKPTTYYDALTASLLWTMEKIFQVIRDEERSVCQDGEVEQVDWAT